MTAYVFIPQTPVPTLPGAARPSLPPSPLPPTSPPPPPPTPPPSFPSLPSPDGLNDPEPGPDGTLGVILAGLGVTEVDKEAVAEVLGNVGAEAADHFGAGGLVGADDVAEIFGSRRPESAVEPTRSQNMTVSWRRWASGQT